MTEGFLDIRWNDASHLVVDGIEILVSDDPRVYRNVPSEAEGHVLIKNRQALEGLLTRVRPLAPKNVLELGVYRGGSAVLWNLVLRPNCHVVLDRCAPPDCRLEAFISGGQHHGRLHTAYGVDQGDAAQLASILDHFHGEPLDLVIDDASHHYAETRTSFEIVFPRLRPGGLYIIEDWAWAHLPAGVPPELHERPSLANVVFEIILATTTPAAVAEVRVDHFSAEVVRGEAPLVSPIRLAELYMNRGLPFRPLL
jgi:predicted O-methyltransferase YrrM